MKRLLILLTAIAIVVLLSAFLLSESKAPEYTIELGGTQIVVEIADTQQARERGLSGRPELGEGKGLFLIFDEPGIYRIWMKDMLFPLDIIWINADGQIISMKEYAEPCTSECSTYAPESAAKYAVEVDAGFCDSHELKEGDSALLSLP